MTKRLSLALLMCACLVIPSTARADDGGWLDWLFRMDPKFWGIGSEIHVLCLDSAGHRVKNCEQGYKNLRRLLRGHLPQNEVEFDKIKHEFDARFGFYWSYGDTFHEVSDQDRLHALKLMGMYHYHFNRTVELGAGAGFINFTGQDIERVSGPILTPLSVVIAPIRSTWAAPLSVVVERSYIFKQIGQGVPAPAQSYGGGEWNWSVAVCYDFRRMPVVRR
jgi:hypothetical protein